MPAISEQLVREIATANPAAARVFEDLGIDYCCGGNRSLSAACASANVAVETVLGLLETSQPPSETRAWNHAPLSDLTRHIVEHHHGFVRLESPRILSLLDKVSTKHGPAHPELSQISELFASLASELEEHMKIEEYILFPYIESLTCAAEPTACFASVESPIQVMVDDHESAGAILSKIHALTGGYQPPADACAAFQTLYRKLEEFERDLHWHVHLENNILFPRAIAAEQERGKASALAH